MDQTKLIYIVGSVIILGVVIYYLTRTSNKEGFADEEMKQYDELVKQYYEWLEKNPDPSLGFNADGSPKLLFEGTPFAGYGLKGRKWNYENEQPTHYQITEITEMKPERFTDEEYKQYDKLVKDHCRWLIANPNPDPSEARKVIFEGTPFAGLGHGVPRSVEACQDKYPDLFEGFGPKEISQLINVPMAELEKRSFVPSGCDKHECPDGVYNCLQGQVMLGYGPYCTPGCMEQPKCVAANHHKEFCPSTYKNKKLVGGYFPPQGNMYAKPSAQYKCLYS